MREEDGAVPLPLFPDNSGENNNRDHNERASPTNLPPFGIRYAARSVSDKTERGILTADANLVRA